MYGGEKVATSIKFCNKKMRVIKRKLNMCIKLKSFE